MLKLEDLKGLSAVDIFMVIVTVIAVLVPGYLAFFLFKSELFGTLDLTKISAVCAAITIPGLIVNIFFSFSMLRISKMEGAPAGSNLSQTKIYVGIAGLMSIVINYAVLLFVYLTNDDPSTGFKSFATGMALVEGALLVLITPTYFLFGKGKKN